MTKKVIAIPQDKKIVINPNAWTYADYLKFSQLATTDVRATYLKMQEIIVSWDYDVDPHATNALAQLPIHEGAKVIETIKNTLNDLLEQSVVDVRVDLMGAGWNALDMQDFYEALGAYDYKEIQRRLYQVCSIDGVEKGSNLSLIDGVAMVEALKKRHQEIMQGKF